MAEVMTKKMVSVGCAMATVDEESTSSSSPGLATFLLQRPHSPCQEGTQGRNEGTGTPLAHSPDYHWTDAELAGTKSIRNQSISGSASAVPEVGVTLETLTSDATQNLTSHMLCQRLCARRSQRRK